MKSAMAVFFTCVCALVLAGCDGGGVAYNLIEGTVTYNGAPCADANVSLMFDDGSTSVGTTGPDGKFEVSTNGKPGAPTGKAKVAVTKLKSGATTMTPEDMAKMAAGGGTVEIKPELPAKYGDVTTSGLTVEVVAGGKDKNKFTLPLVD